MANGGETWVRPCDRAARASRHDWPAQLRSVRMNRRLMLVPVDLPVDVVVVLEQEERANEAECAERVLRGHGRSRRGEHVFVR